MPWAGKVTVDFLLFFVCFFVWMRNRNILTQLVNLNSDVSACKKPPQMPGGRVRGYAMAQGPPNTWGCMTVCVCISVSPTKQQAVWEPGLSLVPWLWQKSFGEMKWMHSWGCDGGSKSRIQIGPVVQKEMGILWKADPHMLQSRVNCWHSGLLGTLLRIGGWSAGLCWSIAGQRCSVSESWLWAVWLAH